MIAMNKTQIITLLLVFILQNIIDAKFEGDCNSDGIVNIADLTGDCNSDNQVDISDLAIISANWLRNERSIEANVINWVSIDGSDTSGNGSVYAPFRSIDKAVKSGIKAGQTVTIYIDDQEISFDAVESGSRIIDADDALMNGTTYYIVPSPNVAGSVSINVTTDEFLLARKVAGKFDIKFININILDKSNTIKKMFRMYQQEGATIRTNKCKFRAGGTNGVIFDLAGTPGAGTNIEVNSSLLEANRTIYSNGAGNISFKNKSNIKLVGNNARFMVLNGNGGGNITINANISTPNTSGSCYAFEFDNNCGQFGNITIDQVQSDLSNVDSGRWFEKKGGSFQSLNVINSIIASPGSAFNIPNNCYSISFFDNIDIFSRDETSIILGSVDEIGNGINTTGITNVNITGGVIQSANAGAINLSVNNSVVSNVAILGTGHCFTIHSSDCKISFNKIIGRKHNSGTRGPVCAVALANWGSRNVISHNTVYSTGTCFLVGLTHSEDENLYVNWPYSHDNVITYNIFVNTHYNRYAFWDYEGMASYNANPPRNDIYNGNHIRGENNDSMNDYVDFNCYYNYANQNRIARIGYIDITASDSSNDHAQICKNPEELQSAWKTSGKNGGYWNINYGEINDQNSIMDDPQLNSNFIPISGGPCDLAEGYYIGAFLPISTEEY